MEISVLGQVVSISKQREAYNNYRLLFQVEADKAKSIFQDLYQQNTSLDMVINNVPGQIEQSMEPALELCIKILMEHNVLTIDKTQFETQYNDVRDIWGEPFLKVYDQYAEIVLDQKSLDEYRVARRQCRSRWHGGGFSLSGALQGTATAGALNLVTGAGHMIFNGMGKIVSSISASMQKSKIFSASETYDSLAKGVWDATFFLHLALIDCLDKTGTDHEPLAGAVSPDDAQSALAILNNAHLTEDLEQCRSAMIQSFQLNPYQEDWYRFALAQFGDSDGTLSEAERYFGLDVIQREKAAQLDAFAQSFSLDTEEQALVAASQISQEKQRLHYSGETAYTQIVLDAVRKFDKQYRTVDGLTLSSREEADAARSELASIENIERQVNYESLASIAEGEQALAAYSSPVAKQHREALREAWANLDTQLRTVDTLLPSGKKILCKTEQAAQQLRPMVDNLYRQLAACGDGESAEAGLTALKESLTGSSVPTALAGCYAQEIDNRLGAIDLALRTTLGKEYSTREAARAAERQYEQIKTEFSSGNPRKHGDRFRTQINAADFSEATKQELLGELFQLENATELKTAKTFSTISTIILLAIMIASYFFQLSGTPDFARKDVVVKGISLMVTDVQIVDSFTFVDGLKNGLVVFGRCLGDVFVNGFSDYVGGFDYGLLGNIIWAFLGLVWVVFKHFLIFIPRYFVSLVMTLFQSAPITYHIGYVIGAAVPLAVSQLCFDEDEQEENVRRIKGWTKKKIFLTVFIVLLVIAVAAYFIQSGL